MSMSVARGQSATGAARDVARWACAGARRVLDGYRRDRLAIPTVADPAREGTVYFLLGDYNVPSGGFRVVYRHVDILNANGTKASVLHRHPGFRCSWFENQTTVKDTQSVAVSPSDVLVVSELDVDLLTALPRGIPHVVFNQGVHLTLNRDAGKVVRHYLNSPDLRAIVTASEHGAAMLRFAFPGRRVHRVHLGIDAQTFRMGTEARPKRIGYMPRRGRADATLTLDILKYRGALQGWDVVPIDGLDENGVGDALRQCRIFLTFSTQEGFGLPAAEAMACGAYVIGFHGFGGREFFLPEFSCPVPTSDVLAAASAIEEAIRLEEEEPGRCARLGQSAAAFVHENYAPRREAAEVTALYSQLLGTVSPASAMGVLP